MSHELMLIADSRASSVLHLLPRTPYRLLMFQTFSPVSCLINMNATVLFDSSCNLCNGLVRFIKRRDKRKLFCFVSMQSEEGRKLLLSAYLPVNEMNTAVYITKGRIYLRSSAMLNILKDLGRGWKILYVFITVPPFIRDFAYKVVARNRYHLFGRKDCCKVN